MGYKGFLAFISGVAVGAIGSWSLLKKYYELRRMEDYDAIRESYIRREEKMKDKVMDDGEARVLATEAREKPDITEYAARVRNEGYVDYSAMSVKKEQPVIVEDNEDEEELKPYVITPEEFDNKLGYEISSLTYYADGVLTDINDTVVEDIDDVVGLESLNHFGEYDDDAVYVRNDRLRTDYEILLDSRKYHDKVHKTDQQSTED